MKKCFTINPMRKKEEFLSFYKLLEENIYQAVEIFYPYKQEKEQYIEYSNGVKYIVDNFKNVEIVLHLPHAPYNGLCLDEHLRAGSVEVMKDAADYAATFDARKLTLHLGSIDQNKPRSHYVKKIIPILRDLCDYVKKNHQYLMIENMPGKNELGYSPEELKVILDGVERDNIKFIFDTGHAHCSEYNDTDFLYLLKDYLYHLHYSDNDGTRDAHGRLGSGNIDFVKHFKALKDINYQELHCMEVIYHTADDLRLYAEDFKKFEDLL